MIYIKTTIGCITWSEAEPSIFSKDYLPMVESVKAEGDEINFIQNNIAVMPSGNSIWWGNDAKFIASFLRHWTNMRVKEKEEV